MGIYLQKGCLYINKRNVVVLVKDIKHLDGSDAISEIIVLKQGESDPIAISPRSWQKDEYKKYGFFVTVKADDPSMGSVTGGGAFEQKGESVLKAIPNQGFTFAQWNDGVTDNPRRINVTQDAEYTAFFRSEKQGKEIVITIKANDDTMGAVSGSGKYITNSKIEICATPNEGYLFVRWNDGSRDNRRIIMPKSNKTYTAIFCKEKENVESSGMMNEKAFSKLKKVKNLLIALSVIIGFVVLFLCVSLVQSKKKNDRIKNEYTNIIRDNKAQIESLTLSINNLQDDTTRKQITIDSLLKLEPYRRIKELGNKLKSANNENDDLNKQNHIKEDSIKELKKRIRELENQHPRIIELEKEVRQKSDSIKALKSQIETLNNQIASKESSIRELNGQVDSKDKSIKEQGKQVKQKENENKNLKKNCDDFEFQLSKANDSINSLKSELANKEKKIEEMNGTITKKNEEIELLNNTIKGIK